MYTNSVSSRKVEVGGCYFNSLRSIVAQLHELISDLGHEEWGVRSEETRAHSCARIRLQRAFANASLSTARIGRVSWIA